MVKREDVIQSHIFKHKYYSTKNIRLFKLAALSGLAILSFLLFKDLYAKQR